MNFFSSLIDASSSNIPVTDSMSVHEEPFPNKFLSFVVDGGISRKGKMQFCLISILQLIPLLHESKVLHFLIVLI